MTRALQRFCEIVDMVAGILLGFATLLVVATAVARYFFSFAIPDAFDITRLVIGACLMWGFASIGFRGGHITVDVLYEVVGERARKLLNAISWGSLLFFTALLAYQMYFRLTSAYASNEATFDLRLPAWPFIGVIWVGCLFAVITTTAAVLVKPETDKEAHPEETGI